MLAQDVGIVMSDGPDEGRKVSVRVRIRLPETAWIASVSTAFPDATFRLLAGIPTDRGAMHLGEIRSDRPDRVAAAVREHPSVLEYQQLHGDGDRSLARYEAAETGLYAFLERTAVVPDYPVVVRDGWFTVDVTDTRERVTSLRENLDAAGMPFEVLSLVEPGPDDRPLTARQREALDVAIRSGYFEVPRESTLAEVADALDVDTSTASGVIRRATATLVKRARTGPEGPV